MAIDLHTHSTASDGLFSPKDVARLAHEKGLTAVALTDHDTTAGLEEFMSAKYDGMENIPGVELSSRFFTREIHIVGLWVDYQNEEFQKFLLSQRVDRARRNEEIRLKLKYLGYKLTFEEEEFQGIDLANAGRPHFARALVRLYGFETPQKVFDELLGNGKPGYVPRRLAHPDAAIAAIKAAGGVSVWAHPTYREKNERHFIRKVIKRFAPLGLDAVEAYYSLFSANETAMMKEFAQIYKLECSGGSDFHGQEDCDIGIGRGGLRVPDELLEQLRSRIVKR